MKNITVKCNSFNLRKRENISDMTENTVEYAWLGGGGVVLGGGRSLERNKREKRMDLRKNKEKG